MSDSTTNILDLKKTIAKFHRDRNWAKWHDPKSVALSILIEAAELAEHFQWSQKEHVAKFDRKKWREIEHELADVLIYCIGFANDNTIDISAAVSRKIALNRLKYPIHLFKKHYDFGMRKVKMAHRKK